MAALVSAINIVPAPVIPATQPVTVASTVAAATEANRAAFLALLAIGNQEKASNDNAITPVAPSGASIADASLNVEGPALLLLNEVPPEPEEQPAEIPPTGDPIAQRLEQASILLNNEQAVEAAASLNSNTFVTGDTTSAELSVAPPATVQARGGSNAVGVTVPAPAQLEQLRAILAPLANEPLTPALLLNIQEQVAAVTLTPEPLTMATIFLVLNPTLSMRKTGIPDKHEEVAAIASVGRSAIEDRTVT